MAFTKSIVWMGAAVGGIVGRIFIYTICLSQERPKLSPMGPLKYSILLIPCTHRIKDRSKIARERAVCEALSLLLPRRYNTCLAGDQTLDEYLNF